ncbi:MAG: hypothetical protein MUE40_12075, partial [Anaerolineae bacterium]|nr:hypothetical protein [Anaerolineae bacterium]
MFTPAVFTHPETIQTCCPSCGTHTAFTRIGIQQWPARVAAAAGLPERIAIYRCEACLTSLNEA